MGGEWTPMTLGSIAAQDGYGIVDGPFGSNLPASCYTPNGIPVIRGSNLSLGITRFHSGEFVFVSQDTAKRLARSLCRPFDIIFTKKGTLGQTGFVPDKGPYSLYLLSSNQMKLTVNPHLADPLFVYYYVSSPESTRKIIQDSEATGVPKTNVAYLRTLPIVLPSLNEQRAIAHILGTLDDKIELNRRMNETLEAIARALFKSWFVDFDPVRAKAEGRDTGLPKEIADLFPDSFEDSELGEIPRGWGVASIGDVAEVIDCLHSKKPERREVGKPFLQLWNIRDDGLIDMRDTYYIEESDYKTWVSRMEACTGDCVVTNVGRVGAVAQLPSGLKAALGRNMTGIRCRRAFPYPTVLVECMLSEATKNEIVLNMDTGTILDALNVRNIPKLRFVRATDDIYCLFEKNVRPLRAHMEAGLAHSHTLSALRDTLLPKLISGELRIKDAEHFLETAA